MTPFGRRLAAEFEQEFSRLANEWYLEWHALARGEPIDLDDFRGGHIRLCGMRFDAIAALAYWNAAARYAQGKLEKTFGLAEEEIQRRKMALIERYRSLSLRQKIALLAVSFVRGHARPSPVFPLTLVLAALVFFFSCATATAGVCESTAHALAGGKLPAQLSTVRFANARPNPVQRPGG